jgi:hypothetical protein
LLVVSLHTQVEPVLSHAVMPCLHTVGLVVHATPTWHGTQDWLGLQKPPSHGWFVEVRAQPAVSVSTPASAAHAPLMQVCSVRVRAREPLSAQVEEYEQLPYAP